MFLTENPFLSGYSFFRSIDRRCRVFLPQPSVSWLLVSISPMSQFIRSNSSFAAYMAFCWAKIRYFLVTSKVLGKNVGMVIKKLALCIQHNTAQKASPPLFWIIDLVQDVIILSNKVTIALQPSTYILNVCCD